MRFSDEFDQTTGVCQNQQFYRSGSRGKYSRVSTRQRLISPTENSDGEMATSSLTTLLSRVSGNSTQEVDNLIGELQIVRKKPQVDGTRIRRDIEEYAALSQSVMQLTKIVSDSMKKLPDASGVNE
jgi:hypothetical protein